MAKFRLIDLDERLFSQKMRDVFGSLVDIYEKDTKMGYLKSVPSNYGYVFFWFGFLDEEALSKYYKDYVSKSKLKKIEEAREKEELFSLRDHIRDDLFPIVYDHPDTIGGGFAEVYLAILNADFKEMSIDEAIHVLRRQAKKLERLDEFGDKVLRKMDIEVHYETIKFADLHANAEEIGALISEDFSEDYEHIFRKEGWEICLRIDFDGDDALKEVVERIDKTISPIRGIIDKMVRYESSFFPF